MITGDIGIAGARNIRRMFETGHAVEWLPANSIQDLIERNLNTGATHGLAFSNHLLASCQICRVSANGFTLIGDFTCPASELTPVNQGISRNIQGRAPNPELRSAIAQNER